MSATPMFGIAPTPSTARTHCLSKPSTTIPPIFDYHTTKVWDMYDSVSYISCIRVVYMSYIKERILGEPCHNPKPNILRDSLFTYHTPPIRELGELFFMRTYLVRWLSGGVAATWRGLNGVNPDRTPDKRTKNHITNSNMSDTIRWEGAIRIHSHSFHSFRMLYLPQNQFVTAVFHTLFLIR